MIKQFHKYRFIWITFLAFLLSTLIDGTFTLYFLEVSTEEANWLISWLISMFGKWILIPGIIIQLAVFLIIVLACLKIDWDITAFCLLLTFTAAHLYGAISWLYKLGLYQLVPILQLESLWIMVVLGIVLDILGWGFKKLTIVFKKKKK